MTTIILASTSPARLALLRAAGLSPTVIPSGVDESVVTRDTPRELTLALAEAKATAVARRLEAGLVVGCDSVLELTTVPELTGVAIGKPASADAARSLWLRMSGQTGTLWTGHCVIDAATGRSVTGAGATEIQFGIPDESDIDAYIASGEPLVVAGSFTLDGRGGWFIEAIRGDYGNVVGLSLPLLRRLLSQLGTGVAELWAAAEQAPVPGA